MKKSFLILGFIILNSALAHTIVGTPPGKGYKKTRLNVDGVNSECKVIIKEVKNFDGEDSFGNPAYQVLVRIELEGYKFDWDKSKKISDAFEALISNIHDDNGQTMVSDTHYGKKNGLQVVFDLDGQIKQALFTYKFNQVSCVF